MPRWGGCPRDLPDRAQPFHASTRAHALGSWSFVAIGLCERAFTTVRLRGGKMSTPTTSPAGSSHVVATSSVVYGSTEPVVVRVISIRHRRDAGPEVVVDVMTIPSSPRLREGLVIRGRIGPRHRLGPPRQVVLVQHGEAARDEADPPLATGAASRRRLRPSSPLTDDDRLVSSTLRRAVQTARATGRATEQVRDLDEFRFGPAWTWEQGDARGPGAVATGAPCRRRSLPRVPGARSRPSTPLPADPPPGRLVAVVHSGVMGRRGPLGVQPAPDALTTTRPGRTRR